MVVVVMMMMMMMTIVITGEYGRRSGERVASESGASDSKLGDLMCGSWWTKQTRGWVFTEFLS